MGNLRGIEFNLNRFDWGICLTPLFLRGLFLSSFLKALGWILKGMNDNCAADSFPNELKFSSPLRLFWLNFLVFISRFGLHFAWFLAFHCLVLSDNMRRLTLLFLANVPGEMRSWIISILRKFLSPEVIRVSRRFGLGLCSFRLQR